MQQLKQKMFKYLAVICGTVFLGWQQAGQYWPERCLRVSRRSGRRAPQETTKAGWHGSSTQRSWLNKANLAFNPAENLAAGK